MARRLIIDVPDDVYAALEAVAKRGSRPKSVEKHAREVLETFGTTELSEQYWRGAKLLHAMRKAKTPAELEEAMRGRHYDGRVCAALAAGVWYGLVEKGVWHALEALRKRMLEELERRQKAKDPMQAERTGEPGQTGLAD